MLVTNINGTLLHSNHEVSSKYFEIFEHLKKQNILFIATNGSPYYSLAEKLQAIKEHINIVAENGGLVLQNLWVN